MSIAKTRKFRITVYSSDDYRTLKTVTVKLAHERMLPKAIEGVKALTEAENGIGMDMHENVVEITQILAHTYES